MWVTTLSQKLIIARIAECNRDGIFSKSLVDVGCDNIPKSQKKGFWRSVGYILFFLHSRYIRMYFFVSWGLWGGGVHPRVPPLDPPLHAIHCAINMSWLQQVALSLLLNLEFLRKGTMLSVPLQYSPNDLWQFFFFFFVGWDHLMISESKNLSIHLFFYFSQIFFYFSTLNSFFLKSTFK